MVVSVTDTVYQAKCEADKQIAALNETVSRLQQQLKSAECDKATLQDQLPKLQDEIARLQRKLTTADAAQQQLNEVRPHDFQLILIMVVYQSRSGLNDAFQCFDASTLLLCGTKNITITTNKS